MKLVYFYITVFVVVSLICFTSCKKKDSSGSSGSSGSLAGSWQLCNGPSCDAVESVVISGNTIYAGNGILWKSDDFGKNWTMIRNGTNAVPSNGTIIHGDTILTMGSEVYRSVDKGGSWTQLGTDVVNCCTKTMAWSGKTIVVTTYNYGPVEISIDNGLTWKTCGSDIPGYETHGATILGHDIFVAADGYGIYKSSDNGLTFSPSNFGLTTLNIGTIDVCGDKLYAGTADGLFVSTDHGGNWSSVDNTFFHNKSLQHLAFNGSTILAGGYDGFYYSTDDGATWSDQVNGMVTREIWSMSAEGNNFLAGTRRGLYLSTNGGQNWKAIGLPGSTRSFACDGSDMFTCVPDYSEGSYMTSDYGENWNFLPANNLNFQIFDISWTGSVLMAATDSGVYISSDRGLSWINKSHGIPVDEYNFVYRVGGKENNLFAGTNSTGIFISHDGGNTWNHAPLPILDEFYAMQFYFNTDGVYVPTFCGGVLFSADNGETWASYTSGLPGITGYTAVTGIGTRLFVSTFKGVYSSGDKGHSWSLAGSELSGIIIRSLTSHGTDLFAATDANGVYMSKDQGASWFPINDGLPPKISGYNVTVNGSWIFFGSGSGVWRHPY